MTWLISPAVNSAALLLADWLIDSIHISGILSAIIAALALGIINTLIRPVLFLVTLPITALTLGLFIFVINTITFALAAFLVPGFYVLSFGGAFWGAIITSLVSWVLNRVINQD